MFLPEVGLGTWNYHGGPAPLRAGLAAGALFLDTAESYGTETVVGEAVRGLRDQVFLATKVSPHHFRGPDLRNSVDASLRQLGAGVIDLLQLHEPNPAIPVEETMGALADLVDAGKVRFVGVSNFSVPQLEAARQALGRYPVVSNQVRYNLVDRTIEGGLLQHCQAHGITVIAYSPLARDLARVRDADPTGALDELARETGHSVPQILLNWCLSKPGVVVIPKGNSEQHVLDNCAASDWRLTADQLALLDTRIQSRRRTRLDAVLRRNLPSPLQALAVRTAKYLPRSVRRRFV